MLNREDEVRPSDEKTSKSAAQALETYFRNIKVLNQAFSEPGQAFRDSHAPAQPGSPAQERAMLWLGCNVLRTPHLLQLAANIVQRLNPELSVLGGRAHCCGSPMADEADRQRALGLAVDGFRKEGAGTLITWCPACHTNLRNGSAPAGWGFEELHITEYLAARLERLKLRPRNSIRILLHGHTGAPDRDKDMRYCRKILEAIPGIAVVGECCDAELGLHCVPTLLAPKIGAQAFERKLQGILREAHAAGADMMVTIYHSCYRELEKRLGALSFSSTASPEPGPVIENYITLLAQALDVPVPANLYREVAHADPAHLVQITTQLQSRLPGQGKLESVIEAEFPRFGRQGNPD